MLAWRKKISTEELVFSSVEWIYRFVRGDCCKSQQSHNLASKIV